MTNTTTGNHDNDNDDNINNSINTTASATTTTTTDNIDFSNHSSYNNRNNDNDDNDDDDNIDNSNYNAACIKINLGNYSRKAGLLKKIDKDSVLRAIVLAKAKADLQYLKVKWKGFDQQSMDKNDAGIMKKSIALIKKLVDNQYDCQRKEVDKFAEAIHFKIKELYGIEDIKQIQRSLNEIYGRQTYRIHLFEVMDDSCKHIWSGATPSQRNILIIKLHGHFDVPRNMLKLLNDSSFCFDCLQINRYKHSHRCDWTCRSCGESIMVCNAIDKEFTQQCENCNITFLSLQCLERHRKKANNGGSRCNVVQFCRLCNRFYNKKNFAPGEVHVCGNSQYCLRCCRHVEPIKTHACYTRMPTEAAKKRYKEKEKTVKIIAFDLECSQSKEKEDGTFEYLDNHEVVCVAARKACHDCFEARRTNKNANCSKCGHDKLLISYRDSKDILNDFIDWLFQPQHDGSYLFAHFGGRYDYLLLLQAMLKRKITPNVSMKGRRIIFGTVIHNECTLHLRDSYNLIPLPLGSFKKAFGLKSCDDKGEFPFLLIEERWYHSSFHGLPALKYYNIDAKTVEKREDFLKWYHGHNPDEYVFNFDDELITYCKKDVDLLLMGLIEYRHAILQLTSWDPIPAAATLASFTAFILRCDHTKPRVLCNFPDNGFSFNRQQSDIAIRWIKWQMHQTGDHIEHVENGGEKKIVLPSITTHVDGFSIRRSDGKPVIYEFYGCYHHGCPKCFAPNELNKLAQQSFGVLYAMAMERLKKLSEAYEVVSIWECDVKKQLSSSKEMRKFFSNCESSRLVLRTSMQGGRTEAHARLAKSSNDKKIVYYDVNSLYPTVMSTCDLPIGPAEIKRSDFPPVPSRDFPYTGLGHVRILPPQTLRYPLLAVKMNNTLMFTLCKACGSKKLGKKCRHTDDERSIVGTWTHVELRKAISLGYVILAYYEVWIWETFSSTLFKDYVKTFYTVKISSSGWPKWVKTDDDKKKCLANYKETMGIELNIDDIEDNPALRSVSKLLLNTSWGKYAQNPSVRTTLFCNGDEFIEIMSTKMNRVATYHEIDVDLYIVSLKLNAEEIHSTPYGNLPLACYITSHARLILYSMLEASNGNGLYNDTDSIIAVIPRDESQNPFKSMLGDGLGKLTDETPGKLIKRAVFGGAKQYGLELIDEKTGEVSHILKIRGQTLDYEAKKIINFKNFRRVVKSGSSVETRRINLKRTATGIKTIPELKRYKAVNEKGFYIYGKVFPFGFNDPLEEARAKEEEESESEDSDGEGMDNDKETRR